MGNMILLSFKLFFSNDVKRKKKIFEYTIVPDEILRGEKTEKNDFFLHNIKKALTI